MSVITKPMLADPYDPAIGITFPALATPKLDGIRALRIDSRVLSRKFLDIPNRHVQATMVNLPDGLDGELIVEGMTFNQIQSFIMSEDKTPDFKYYVFDYITSSLTEPYCDRMEKLKKIKLPAFCVKLLPKLIHNMEELEAYIDECEKAGYEGVMTRAVKGPYKCGRATAKQGYLLKFKKWQDSEAEVIGFVEQMRNENEATVDELGHTKRSKAAEGLVPAGTLGKFLVREVGSTKWKGMEFGCGSGEGLTKELRQEIWDNRDKYLGRIITYKYQPHGVKVVPRFPIWKGFRDPRDMS